MFPPSCVGDISRSCGSSLIGGGDKMSRMKKDVNLGGFLLKRSENMKNIMNLKIVNLHRKTDLFRAYTIETTSVRKGQS